VVFLQMGQGLIGGCLAIWRSWSDMPAVARREAVFDDTEIRTSLERIDEVVERCLTAMAAPSKIAANWLSLGKCVCSGEWREFLHSREGAWVPLGSFPPLWVWTNLDRLRDLMQEAETDLAELLPIAAASNGVAARFPYALDRYAVWLRAELGLQTLLASRLESGEESQPVDTSANRLSSAPSDPLPDNDTEPFVLLPQHRSILDALNGKALRSECLAHTANLDKRSLFNRKRKTGKIKLGLIPELTKHGLIRHHDRLGYYRPDAPPPELRPSGPQTDTNSPQR